MKQYGLLGQSLKHSFSKKYFTEKFSREHIDAQYELYELETINAFKDLLKQQYLSGLNVTIPYKEAVIGLIDELDETSQKIGAVNVIKFIRSTDGLKLRGYNSDVIGFIESIRPAIKASHKKALILGTGGASKAVKYGLETLGLTCKYVSRSAKTDQLTYTDINAEVLAEYTVIVNTTPLGMYPAIDTFPPIPYEYLTTSHVLFDAVYNPEVTQFLALGAKQGANCINGKEMLHLQAEAAWSIWNQ